MDSKIIRSRMPQSATWQERVDALKALLAEEAESLRHIEGEGETLYKVIDKAYLRPVGKDQAAAGHLDMSYATFWRTNKKGNQARGDSFE